MRSFAEAHPELVPEWGDSSLRPDEVSYGSSKKVCWTGRCGHTWHASIKNRGKGSGCPYCTGRRVLAGFNDLASKNPGLAAEWSSSNFPLEPTGVMEKSNLKVRWHCGDCGQEWMARIADRTGGSGCPICSGERLVPGVNDFATAFPKLTEEWSGKNEGQPSMFWPKSRKKVWWHCNDCGHEWMAAIDSRAKGQGCPACAGRAVERGQNDLATVRPRLAEEWDMERNHGLLPQEILPSSMKAVYWKDCHGHRWKARISDRMAGAGCPVCEEKQKEYMKQQIVKHYAEKAGEAVRFGEDAQIGIALDMFLPGKRAAIEYSSPEHYKGRGLRRENAKNWLCLNAGIKMFRILSPGVPESDNCICITLAEDSYSALGTALQFIFRKLGIEVDVDIQRDLKEIGAKGKA